MGLPEVFLVVVTSVLHHILTSFSLLLALDPRPSKYILPVLYLV